MRALVVGTGAGGGLGRYELVLDRMLRAADWCEPSFAYRRSHPRYLDPKQRPGVPDARTKSVQKFLREIAQLSRRHDPHVLLFTHINLARAWAISFGRPRPYAVATHGVEVWGHLGPLQRRALRSARCVFSPSAFTARAVKAAAGVTPVVIPETLEPSWFGDEEDEVGRARDVTLLTVSRLDDTESAKHIDWVIRGLAAVAAEAQAPRLVIVGRGPGRAQLQALVRDLSVDRHVQFRDDIGAGDLARMYTYATIFALPSEKEGFGLAHLEAMACGLPVIGARAGATPELVLDGVTGLLVDSVAEFTSCLRRLMQDDSLRSRLGAAGKARARSVFGPDRFAARMRSALESLS